jgi:capsular polysaccharide transport system permease protein
MARTATLPRRHPFIQALIDKKSVMGAVMLRDMRTRFFNHGLGFLVVVLWPLVHMMLIIAIHTVATHGAAPPYGNSAPVFFMTGVVPFLAFTYVSRFMAFSVSLNRPMMAFPIVTVNDVLVGRAALEIIAAFATLFFIHLVLWMMGENPFPYDLDRAVTAYLSTLFLAFACGYLIGILYLFFPMIITAYQLMIILMYATSGVFFVPSDLSDSAAYALGYNPVVVCIEWYRTAYFESYSDKLVDGQYVLSFSAIILLLALCLERFFRRKMLEG